MQKKYPYNEIKSLFFEDKTEDALKLLYLWGEQFGDKRIINAVIILMGDYKKINYRLDIGIMELEEFMRIENRISDSALRFNDDLYEVASTYQPIKENTAKRF